MLSVYGLPNCDSTRKALKWLKANGITHNFIPVNDISKAQVSKWLKENGKILNRQSTTWRSLSEEEKILGDSDPAKLIMAKPTLLKRPVIESGERMITGFNEKEYETQILNSKTNRS